MREIDDVFRRFESRYGFVLPAEYKQMHAKGFFDLDPKFQGADCFENIIRPYLWLHDMRWIPPQKILDYEFPNYCLPGFAPFAKMADGSCWCWYPKHTLQGVTSIVLCPRDSKIGEFYAPCFVGALYRQMLDFAWEPVHGDDDVPTRRKHLNRWLEDLGLYFPAKWRDTLSDLATRPMRSWKARHNEHSSLLSPDERKLIVERDLAFPKLNEEFQWMED